jgi:hypothetical protein
MAPGYLLLASFALEPLPSSRAFCRHRRAAPWRRKRPKENVEVCAATTAASDISFQLDGVVGRRRFHIQSLFRVSSCLGLSSPPCIHKLKRSTAAALTVVRGHTPNNLHSLLGIRPTFCRVLRVLSARTMLSLSLSAANLAGRLVLVRVLVGGTVGVVGLSGQYVRTSPS